MKNLKPFLLLLVFFLLAAIGSYIFSDGEVFWTGFAVMLIFYAIIFYLGSYIAKKKQVESASDWLLAGRSIPLFVAVFTMSATWIGGGYINGTAEFTASLGLVWVQAPWGYALSLILGGLFFARKMRRMEYTTMLDPISDRFGKKLTTLFFLPALTGEIFWSAAILTALGTTFGTVLGLDMDTSIILSAIIAIAYTAIGGLWAVALTDVIQLFLLAIGLIIVLPFAFQTVGGIEVAWAAYVEKHGAAATLIPSREALGSSLLELVGLCFVIDFWRNTLASLFSTSAQR